MRVIFLIKSLGVQGGGAERIFLKLAEHLFSNGYQIKLLSFDSPEQSSFYSFSNEIEWIKLGIGDSLRRARLGETLRRMKEIRRTVLRNQPDVVVGFMHSSYIPLAFALVGSGIPIIGSEHIVREHYATRKMQYLLLLLSSFFIARFTVLSKSIRRKYGWLFRRKAEIMPNPVFLPEASENLSEAAKRKIILSVGKLEPQKDHLTLIMAFYRLADKIADWDLRIVGEGTLRETLERRVGELGLEERVALPGAVKNIGDEYKKAEIFVLPSRYESFGLVTLEAMSAGLPVIGFRDCPGTNELIDDGVNGILVDPDDRTTNLSKAIEDLIGAPKKANQLAAVALRTLSAYEPEVFFGRWSALLEKVYKSNEKKIRHPKRLATFLRRLTLLSPAVGWFQAIRVLIQFKILPNALLTVPYMGCRLTLRRSDILAVMEVLGSQEYDFLRGMLRRKGSIQVMDIGAHIGTFAIWVFSVNPEAHVTSVEADPATYEILRSNAAEFSKRGMKWNTIWAAAGKDDESVLRFSDAGPTMSHRVDPSGSINVNSISLASLVSRLPPQSELIDLLKVDIEGSEVEFLTSDPKAFEQIACLAVELHPYISAPESLEKMLERIYGKAEVFYTEHSDKPLLLSMRK